MIWPAIDLAQGAVVQLVQGEREALRRDLDQTLAWLDGAPRVQVVDLDAARGQGSNTALVARCCRAGFRVRLGGGLRTLAAAERALQAGANEIIIGSAAYRGSLDTPRTTDVGFDFPFLESLQTLGRERIVIAIDTRSGHVASHGWRHSTPNTAAEAIRALSPYCGAFLFTSIETEGGLGGLPLAPVLELRALAFERSRRLSVAGGIATRPELKRLVALGCEPVLGMALYTGAIPLAALSET